jgi:NADH dehydrogenase
MTLPCILPVIHGATKFQPVHVGDVAQAVTAALDRNGTEGRIYELGGPKVWTFWELMAFVLKETGRNRRLVGIPSRLAGLMAWLGEWLPNPPLTRDHLRLLERDNIVAEGALTLAELGIAPAAVEALVPFYLSRFRPGGGRRVRPAA